MKLNITPGPWVVDGWDLYDKDGKFFEDTSNDREAETTAVNNTYHKGINPEAVPEMLSALEALVKTSDLTNIPVGIVETLKQIIQKATLCPTTS